MRYSLPFPAAASGQKCIGKCVDVGGGGSGSGLSPWRRISLGSPFAHLLYILVVHAAVFSSDFSRAIKVWPAASTCASLYICVFMRACVCVLQETEIWSCSIARAGRISRYRPRRSRPRRRPSSMTIATVSGYRVTMTRVSISIYTRPMDIKSPRLFLLRIARVSVCICVYRLLASIRHGIAGVSSLASFWRSFLVIFSIVRGIKL